MSTHITILLPNRPGEFYKAARLLGNAGINIIGFHLASEGKTSILQLLTDNPKGAFKLLRQHYSFYCAEREVLTVRLKHEPGALGSVLELLQGINLANSYQYGVTDDSALVIIEFDDPAETEKAHQALKKKGFKVSSDRVLPHGR